MREAQNNNTIGTAVHRQAAIAALADRDRRRYVTNEQYNLCAAAGKIVAHVQMMQIPREIWRRCAAKKTTCRRNSSARSCERRNRRGQRPDG